MLFSENTHLLGPKFKLGIVEDKSDINNNVDENTIKTSITDNSYEEGYFSLYNCKTEIYSSLK